MKVTVKFKIQKSYTQKDHLAFSLSLDNGDELEYPYKIRDRYHNMSLPDNSETLEILTNMKKLREYIRQVVSKFLQEKLKKQNTIDQEIKINELIKKLNSEGVEFEFTEKELY
jgi:hypothetical protein